MSISVYSFTICTSVDMHASFEFFNFSFCCSISSTCFCCVALLFLWCCVAFVFCMPSSSDLLWPPSAREHSADPSGKVCTLDLQCHPSPVPSCSTVPSHQGCTILAKMTLCYTLVDILLHLIVYCIYKDGHLYHWNIHDWLCSPTTLTQPSYPSYDHQVSLATIVAPVSFEMSWFRSRQLHGGAAMLTG